jgi:predicted dehydrogenase
MGRTHFDRLKEYGRLEFKGVFDISPKACKAAAERGLHVYESLDDILGDSELDIILVSATNEVHKSLSIAAMRAGKHVISEKPVTLSSEELAEVMAVAEETGKVFTIDQNRRTNRDFVLMRRNVESGIIGKPVVIESRVEGSRGMPRGWRTLKELGGGMMLDWGVHLIDQILYMQSNDRVKEVYCKMLSIQHPQVDDNFHLMLTFESGLIVIVEVGTNHYIPHPRWYVMGEKGTLQIDNWNCDGKIIRNIDKEDVWDEEIFYTKAGPTKTMAPRSAKSIETITLSWPEDVRDGLPVVYDQFLDAIEGKAPLTITAAQAMRVMRVMEAAFVSANEHRAVEVDL